MVDRLANSEANHRRILMVENAFGSGGESLQGPGRVLVGEGVLTKICRKKPKPRQFFLFNDILVYGNIVIDKKKYNKQHVLGLVDVQLSSLEDDGDLKYGWQIISPNKSFAVYAATATEKAEWMAHINKCINDLRKKSGVAGPSVEGAAVWVPDSNANECMVCKKSKFSAINRRHHCRKCGALVCGSCSKTKWLLPHISSKPVRICAKCYAALRSGAASTKGNEEGSDRSDTPSAAKKRVESCEFPPPPTEDELPEPPPVVELVVPEELAADDRDEDSSDDDVSVHSKPFDGADKAGSSDEEDEDDDEEERHDNGVEGGDSPPETTFYGGGEQD